MTRARLVFSLNTSDRRQKWHNRRTDLNETHKPTSTPACKCTHEQPLHQQHPCHHQHILSTKSTEKQVCVPVKSSQEFTARILREKNRKGKKKKYMPWFFSKQCNVPCFLSLFVVEVWGVRLATICLLVSVLMDCGEAAIIHGKILLIFLASAKTGKRLCTT